MLGDRPNPRRPLIPENEWLASISMLAEVFDDAIKITVGADYWRTSTFIIISRGRNQQLIAGLGGIGERTVGVH